MEQQPIIRLEGVSKTFGSGENAVHALQDIDLSIREGEIFGIIGLSGAGKSTLVRCINLLEKPTSGKVFVSGRELTSLPEHQLRAARRNIGMIFQGFHLLMQKSILDNVCFPLELAGISKKEARPRAQALLDRVGLGDRASAFPAQLSGGQKQRVAIARALATSPKVLLCDEATSALDPTTTQSILELLRQLNRELKVTVVIITHEMKVVEQVCSRVAILDHSRIGEMGPVEEIFRHPKTAAARQLICPQGEPPEAASLGEGRFLRLIFDGSRADRPVVSEMVLSCGAPVNIVFADTRVLSGCLYGQMIVQLPEDEPTLNKMTRYLNEAGVVFEEVR